MRRAHILRAAAALLLAIQLCAAEATAQESGPSGAPEQHTAAAVWTEAAKAEARLHRLRGLEAYRAGRFAEAAREFEQAVGAWPDYAEGHNDLAMARTSLGEFGAAVELLERAVRLQPRTAEMRYNLGTAYYREGRLEESVAALGEAVRLQPRTGAHGNSAFR